MYQEILRTIDNVAVWPVISFVIFFLFFICLLWWVMVVDKKFIEKMKNLPFDEPARGTFQHKSEQP